MADNSLPAANDPHHTTIEQDFWTES